MPQASVADLGTGQVELRRPLMPLQGLGQLLVRNPVRPLEGG